MNSVQYEECCRFFLARKLEQPIKNIQSVQIPNPRRPDLPKYKHQIDLYWESRDAVADYINIANAKWRSSDKVDQPEVLLLQSVRQKVAAHKAVMITSAGFTQGAIAAAKDDGIALYVLNPSIDTARLHSSDRTLIQQILCQIASDNLDSLMRCEVVHRAFDFAGMSNRITESSAYARSHQTRIVQGVQNRAVGGFEHRGGPPSSPGSNKVVKG